MLRLRASQKFAKNKIYDNITLILNLERSEEYNGLTMMCVNNLSTRHFGTIQKQRSFVDFL